MVRLVVSLVILVIALIVRLIVWLVQRSTEPTTKLSNFSYGALPGQRPGGFGYGAPGGAPQGYRGAPGYGAPGGMAQGYGAQGGMAQGYGAQGGMAPPPPAPGSLRLVAAPDCTFERLADCMARAGLLVATPPGPPVAPGEPSSGVWQSDTAQVKYYFDPRTYLRSLEITGPGAAQLRQGLVTLASLPAVDGAQIQRLLATPRPADQMLGLAAAEHLGPGPDTQALGGQLHALSMSPSPDVAQAARRAQQRLGYGM
jgi:hypothetical protein